jgi:Fe-S-cluster containining protein
MTTPAAPQTCRRCGTCCRKGGPAFHTADRDLIAQGHIPARWLYTLRTGEPLQDNVSGGLMWAAGDIVKIKGRDGSWTCHFLDGANSRCTIYAHRPLECRRLECWDTRALEALAGRDLLTRCDLLRDVAGLWELVVHHDQRCSYRRLKALAEDLAGPRAQAAQSGIVEMLRYDESLRELLVGKGQAPAEMLDFLLGRPLAVTLTGFKIKVSRSGGRIQLQHTPLG